MLALHRARQGFVKARTAQANQIRGLLTEYGIVIPQGIHHIAKCLPSILEDGENDLPGPIRALLVRLGEHLQSLDRHVEELEAQIQRGTGTTPRAANWLRFPASGRSRRVHWLPRSAMRSSSRAAGNWRPGWDWCPDSTPVAESQCCCASANVVTPT